MPRRSSPTSRTWIKYWLAWTAAGLFYITQDFMTRLAWNEPVPWLKIVTAWLYAMYICAAFTPAILWLGRRWALDETHRWRHIAIHFAASIAFSLVSTALEVPLLLAIEMLPGGGSHMSFARGFWRLLPF